LTSGDPTDKIFFVDGEFDEKAEQQYKSICTAYLIGIRRIIRTNDELAIP
jgi:hypothetical protein